MKKSLIFSLMILLILAACAPAPGQIPPAPGEPGTTTGVGQAVAAADRGTAWAGERDSAGNLVFSIGQKPDAKTTLFDLSSSSEAASAADARAVTCGEDLDVVLQFAEDNSLLWNKMYSLQNVNGVEKWVALDLFSGNFGGESYTDENGNKWLTGPVNAFLNIPKATLDASLDQLSDGSGNIYVAAYSCVNYGKGINSKWECGCDETSPKDADGKPTQCGGKWRIQSVNVGDTPETSGDTKPLYRYLSTDGKFHYTFATDACTKPIDIKAGENMVPIASFYADSAQGTRGAVYLCDAGTRLSTTLVSSGACSTVADAYYPASADGQNQPFYECGGANGQLYTTSSACEGSWDFTLNGPLPNVVGVIADKDKAKINFARCDIPGFFHYASSEGSQCIPIDSGAGIKTGTLEAVQGKIYKYGGADKVALNECREGLTAPYILAKDCPTGANDKKHILGYVLKNDIADKSTSRPIYRCTKRASFNTGVVTDSFITTEFGCEGSRNHYTGASIARIFKNTGDDYAWNGRHAITRCNAGVSGYNDVIGTVEVGQPCPVGGVSEGTAANLYNEQLTGTDPVYQCWSAGDPKRTKLSPVPDCPNIDNLENRGSHLMGYVYSNPDSTIGVERPFMSCRNGDIFFSSSNTACEGASYGFGKLGYVAGQVTPANTPVFDNCRWTNFPGTGVSLTLETNEFITEVSTTTGEGDIAPISISGLTNEGKVFPGSTGDQVQRMAVKVCKTSSLKWNTITSNANTRNTYCPSSAVPSSFTTDNNGGTRGFGITTDCVATDKPVGFVSEVQGNFGPLRCPAGAFVSGVKALPTSGDRTAEFSIQCSKLQ